MAIGKRRWRHRVVVAAGAAAIVGSVTIALGPAAPWVVDHFADGQRVWRLGHLQIDRVSGSWLGALRAEHLSLADDDGVWFEARDVALDWRPQEILFGVVAIKSAHARSVVIHRQPTLSAPQPPSGANMDVRLDNVRVDQLDIAEQTL